MRFRILGPLEVTSSAAAEPVTPRAAKIRAVLATLLVRANEIVSVDGLVDELWGENPPRTARTTLQVYVSQLRKLLQAADPEYGRDALVTRPPGYALYLDPAQLDLTVFEELHQMGRAALLRGDHAAAADLQRRALRLWRAPLACDTPHGALLARTAVRLAEVRAAALEQRIRAELQLGHHQSLVGELQSVVAEMPMREEFHMLLMTALYCAGRQADALQVFAQLRRALMAELAIEPGQQLQRLHQRILAGDPELLHPAPARRTPQETTAGTTPQKTAPGGRAQQTAAGGRAQQEEADGRAPEAAAGGRVPEEAADGRAPEEAGGRVPEEAAGAAQVQLPGQALDRLPARDPVFIGRAEELDRLDSLLRDVPAGGCAAIAGAAGTGKTALAVAAGHELADLFPDGRVFLELGAGQQAQAEAAGSLTRLLRRFGVQGPLPSDRAGLRRILHRLTEGRRMLLILDGAASPALVRSLLPDTPGSTALITCRRVPDGLTDRVLELDVLPQDEARRLFTAAAGRLIPQACNEASVREIAALCEGLPLALRAAAARLASRPHWGLDMLAARLRGEQRRLAELSAAAPGFHDRLRSSYEETEPVLRHAFRLLGLLPAGPFGPATAAAVLGEDVAKTGDLLSALVQARLLRRVAGGPHHGTHHRLHPLWRLLALECLAAESPAAQARAATARLAAEFTAQLRAADGPAARRGTHPLEWFSRRQEGLVDVVRRCHAAGLWAQTADLADAMTGFLEARAAWEAWETCHTLALDAARHQEDLAAEARLLRSLGDLAWQRRHFTAAGEFYERALLTADAAPAAAERGRALVGLADLQLDAGGLEEAAALLSPALDAVADDPRGRYEAHRVLGLLALQSAGPDAAEAHFADCLNLATALRDARLESYARRWLDRVHGTGHRPPGWSEVRPGVWRLAPCAG
ncbi:AfsR/SARP family transcriptional regulator [Streptomyces sp. NBC_01136]|uniref:BTAD domain-containing putative transcriptional regulator n=1 Tax=Streptomyces sp. NBC_01136 TaxID=2903754 RepID=UPI00386705B1|nr:AfsR/SARP family transcriptional regulator [Streptomyces sp. NBC_01136]WST81110.1 AfsR/SARP family transcriptional regulator [Streptomyces sp. NBC_01136]